MNIVDELPDNAEKIESVFDLVIVSPRYEDFHKPRYGGTIFIKSSLTNFYEYYPFDEFVTSEKIVKYIRTEQLYFAENFVPL